MALSSASPQIANVKDGDKSPPGDLEEGEIEDGELPDEEGETEVENSSKANEQQSNINVHCIVKANKSTEKQDKTNDTSLGRLNRKKVHHNSERNNDQEEEWACVVEKKLKAAMSKDSTSENVNGVSNIQSSEKSYSEEDKKMRRKKRKKKHKEDDDEDKKESKKRKKSHHWVEEEGQNCSSKDKSRDGEDGEDDDDEMLFVRGASPVTREGFRGESPSSKFGEKGFSFSQQGGFDETYDSYNEESDFESREEFTRCNPPLSGDETPKRGVGRGAKRRQRTVTRQLPHNKRQTRKDPKSKRGGLKRQQSSRTNSEREPNVCMFYMQGKCQKGEECPYSHNACPPRKMELCKFYLMDCCAKKDKCLYMHHDFPCKFFHTGLKCFSGPRCKFSHGQLSDAMRSILLKGTEGNRHNELRLSNRPSVPSQEHRSKHLETAPKELLGDFPRLSREGAAAMVYNKKNRSSKTKKIPSLFDIEVPIPAQLLAEQNDGVKDHSPRRTPMPESDNEDQDGTTTPMPLSPVNDGKSKGKSRWGSDDVHGSLSRDSKEDDNPFQDDEEECKTLVPKFYQETDSDNGNKNTNEKEFGKINLHRFAGYSPNPADEKKAIETNVSEKSNCDEKDVKRKTDEKKSQNDAANGDSSTESNDAANIPLHLPKKQRELFLRIQQQQREADSSQDRGGDQDDEMDAVQEENWYSSDEEEDSLTNVLKKLSKQETSTESHDELSTCSSKETRVEQNPPIALPMKMPDLSKIKIDESFTKLLSSICGKKSNEESSCTTTATPIVGSTLEQQTPPVTNISVARDPRLSRDPRNRNPVPVTATSSTVGVSESASVVSTTASTTHSSSYDSARRTDPRRAQDPRSAKSSQKSEYQDLKHSGSSSSRRSSSHSSFPSIYSNAIMGEKTSSLSTGLSLSASGTSAGDIDLRNFLPRSLDTADVDLRNRGDTDLRTGQPPTALVFGDTDLRLRSHDLMSVGQIDSGRSNSDVDLRMLELPFKPVPMHTPATEIDASLTSHPPIPYKVVVVTIPRPDYSSLKLNTSDPQVQSDPRLRKIFKLQSPGSENPSKSTLSNPVVSVSRSDPRRHLSRSNNTSSGGSGGSNVSNISCGSSNTNSSTSNESHELPSETSSIISKSINEKSNPNSVLLANAGIRCSVVTPASSPLLPNPNIRIGRDPRSAPGLLGPAPLPANYCPNTPLFEEHVDLASGMDNDPRVIFNRGSMDAARWDQQLQGSSPLSRNNWRNNRRNPQSRYTEDPRSYTPPI